MSDQARAYYNELDPYAAEWLQNLIAAGEIADGDVDQRSIEDVAPADLVGYTQCHFFAGLGGWSCALRLAGWPDDRPVWTGSCPCQPFSGAGAGGGFADHRHLWPVFFDLIRARNPATVFGEQVASPAGLEWWQLVHDDLEAADYQPWAVDLGAPGVGGAHIRQRLWWLADTDGQNDGGRSYNRSGEIVGAGTRTTLERLAGLRAVSGLGYPEHCRREVGQPQRYGSGPVMPPSPARGLADAAGGLLPLALRGAEGRNGSGPDGEDAAARPTDGFWRDADWLLCRDGRWRPVEPGTSPLAHGVQNRVGRLRAYGNAIVPQVAAEVIGAYMDVTA